MALSSTVLEHFRRDLAQLKPERPYGYVIGVQGLLVEVSNIAKVTAIGGRCRIETPRRDIQAEVVGIRGENALLMAFGRVDGVGAGRRVYVDPTPMVLYPCRAWLGRVINALGEPVDDKGILPHGADGVPIRNVPPSAHARKRLGGKVDLGVRAVNTLLTVCEGQRIGIFAGSGVGKSVLMAMMAKFTDADIAVIGLVGERGREVQEFIQDELGPEGMKRAVVIVATSDESPLLRRQAAYSTLAVAEHFRGEGKNVLCMMDSVTRFAMAQREIGLSAGEPPTTKGYPPTTFTELAKLLERAGPGIDGEGDITGLFTVLVEGDDMNDPIADAVRGILDGHFVLDRKIAERGRYPALNILKSVSRAMPRCHTPFETSLVQETKRLTATYDDMAELIRLGAYKKGSDPDVDRAIMLHGQLEDYLSQRPDERSNMNESTEILAEILGIEADKS